jgi:hypothetical protein
MDSKSEASLGTPTKDESTVTVQEVTEPHLVKQFNFFSSLGMALIIVNVSVPKSR